MKNFKINKKKSQVKLIDRFTDKKNRTIKISNLIKNKVSYNMFKRFGECGDFVDYITDENKKTYRILRSNNCGNRFCALCSWKKSRSEALMISVCMNYIEDISSKNFIFLTLTAKNVEGLELHEEIIKFNKSFKKLMERKEVIKINKGYVRKLEVTYNKEQFITQDTYNNYGDYFKIRGFDVGDINPNYNTYHTHFHVIMAVNKSYFKKNDYITSSRWLELWQNVMNDKSITQVHVQKIYKNGSNPIGKQVYEVAKYTAKDSDYTVNKSVFDIFYNALKGKQLITFNGLFKDALKLYKSFKALKIDELREQHILYKYVPKGDIDYMYYLLYRWGYGNYIEKENRELTDFEKLYFNKLLVDEFNDIE